MREDESLDYLSLVPCLQKLCPDLDEKDLPKGYWVDGPIRKKIRITGRHMMIRGGFDGRGR